MDFNNDYIKALGEMDPKYFRQYGETLLGPLMQDNSFIKADASLDPNKKKSGVAGLYPQSNTTADTLYPRSNTTVDMLKPDDAFPDNPFIGTDPKLERFAASPDLDPQSFKAPEPGFAEKASSFMTNPNIIRALGLTAQALDPQGFGGRLGVGVNQLQDYMDEAPVRSMQLQRMGTELSAMQRGEQRATSPLSPEMQRMAGKETGDMSLEDVVIGADLNKKLRPDHQQSLIGKINPLQATPESMKKFLKTGDYSVLEPREKPEKQDTSHNVVEVPSPDGRTAQKYQFNTETRLYDIPVGSPYKVKSQVPNINVHAPGSGKKGSANSSDSIKLKRLRDVIAGATKGGKDPNPSDVAIITDMADELGYDFAKGPDTPGDRYIPNPFGKNIEVGGKKGTWELTPRGGAATAQPKVAQQPRLTEKSLRADLIKNGHTRKSADDYVRKAKAAGKI